MTYANLDNFNPKNTSVDEKDFTILDKWISSKMNEFIKESKNHYENFEVYKLMKKRFYYFRSSFKLVRKKKSKKILEI